MDQYLSAVIIAAITGAFSVITVLIQKHQEKVINKIDDQTKVIKKEKELKRRLAGYERERQDLINTIMILILDTNLTVMQATDNGTVALTPALQTSDDLKKKCKEISEKIADVNREYQMILSIKEDT